MKFDVKFANLDLKQIPETVRRMEALGFDGVWSWETAHDPFLPLALAAYQSFEPGDPAQETWWAESARQIQEAAAAT